MHDGSPSVGRRRLLTVLMSAPLAGVSVVVPEREPALRAKEPVQRETPRVVPIPKALGDFAADVAARIRAKRAAREGGENV